MKLTELQLCLTTVCKINCDYCHLDKKNDNFISEEIVKNSVDLAKKNDIEYVRLTGGDVFEHPKLEKILKMIKSANLKIILNISFDRYSDALKIKESFDILLVSFQNLAQLEEFNLNNLDKEVMGCIVFQEFWLKDLKKLASLVDSLNFSSFFFLRDVNKPSKNYFIKLNECVERVLQLTKKISFANSFPLCFVAKKNIDFCSGKRFDNGNDRVYITEDGNVKPSAYSNISLGQVSSINLEYAYKTNQERIQLVQNKLDLCKDCVIKDYCGSGIIANKGYSVDPLFNHVFFNNYLTKLQNKIKNILPQSNFSSDLRQTYFENSDFFMRYVPFHVMKKTTPSQLKKIINFKEGKISVYLHFPFCKGFCKFCKIEKLNKKNSDDYINNLILDIENNEELLSNNFVSSIYFGGGCAQLMGVKNAEKVFSKLFGIIKNKVPEVNFELFPDFFDSDLMNYIKKYVNRVSIGLQCFNDDILNEMGRKSSRKDMIDFIKKVKALDFEKVNFDIIYGLFINQKDIFKDDFLDILSFKPDQVTFQPLHFIEELEFHKEKIVNEIELNTTGRQILNQEGFKQVSGEDFSRDNKLFSYQHGLLNCDNLLGLGQGTFSFINGVHFRKASEGLLYYEEQNKEGLYSKLFLGSRLLNVDLDEINKKGDVSLKAFFSDSLRYLLKNEFINIKSNKITFTKLGLEYVDLISNILSLSNLDYKLKK
ncbi:radical SAM protein [Candidatus Woesearchaeota archaeon]|jgi:oxygen-independent coproporphyrinogen III oxidase|nr:radical SAM protein [Candidatus Woesearchaeota archaeon]MBT4367789.1 radical SAM protein [Candidatus Woesearchaeota archaeon]MBT4712277.1 radical SAM protein [Candidatus Woesearchaeota archaeon]MBT6638825.1 radical SAM protein [Candidatus Woesearchaeota archaeon]MBT7134469.1 radical SAM protein [Candidatus Woesearchaeota archaeon]